MASSVSVIDPDQDAGLIAAGILDDPWLDGRRRIDHAPAVLAPATVQALARAATTTAWYLDAAVQAASADPQVLTDLGFDPTLAAIARLDAPRWLTLARADVFLVDDGPAQVCEINCDTPTGLAETVELGALAAAAHPGLADPSARLGERWQALVRQAMPTSASAPLTAGIVDATEMTEDLGHVRLLTRWLEAAGCTVVRGSPFNLHGISADRVGLFDQPLDLLVRHYKTDWWAARRPVRRDEPPCPDPAPLARELSLIAHAQAAGTLAVINPWGAAIGQSKRTLALAWERPALFAAEMRGEVARHLPETRWLESLPLAQLIDERDAWVLKSDFGCEGDEVVLGRDTTAEQWAEAIDAAMPGRWIAQRAFTPRRAADGSIANHGVFLIGGLPSGIFTRRSVGATTRHAVACPTLVDPATGAAA